MGRKIKILIAKPGLDGHDVGAKVVTRALADAGFEVIYTGLRQMPEDVARNALEEDVDVIGLSSLAGSHIHFCTRLKALLDEYELSDKLWIVGGNIPEADRQALRELGVNEVFPTGARLDEIVQFITQRVS